MSFKLNAKLRSENKFLNFVKLFLPECSVFAVSGQSICTNCGSELKFINFFTLLAIQYVPSLLFQRSQSACTHLSKRSAGSFTINKDMY